jgi:hypothetical protein
VSDPSDQALVTAAACRVMVLVIDVEYPVRVADPIVVPVISSGSGR